METIEIEMMSYEQRTTLDTAQLVDAYTVFQTDQEVGFYQWDSSIDEWDYIGGRPPHR